MNKKELVKAVADSTGFQKKELEVVVDHLLQQIASTLSEGEDIKLHGFGTFSVSERAARKGRNPQTGEEIDIAATKSVRFKAAKNLKDQVK